MPKRKSHRIMIQLTEAQMREVRKVRALVAKELPDLIKKDQRLHDAMREPTLSGALRRAVHASKLLLSDIAERATIEVDALEMFLTAEEPLPSDAMDRLARLLRLKLPADRPKPRTAKAS